MELNLHNKNTANKNLRLKFKSVVNKILDEIRRIDTTSKFEIRSSLKPKPLISSSKLTPSEGDSLLELGEDFSMDEKASFKFGNQGKFSTPK